MMSLGFNGELNIGNPLDSDSVIVYTYVRAIVCIKCTIWKLFAREYAIEWMHQTTDNAMKITVIVVHTQQKSNKLLEGIRLGMNEHFSALFICHIFVGSLQFATFI